MHYVWANSCRLIREMGEPGKDGNGKCMGFTRNFTDDEPCEICKKCEWCTAREEGDKIEDRCIMCGEKIPEGIQVCRTCEEKVNNMNKEGYRDDTAEQAIWGVRKEERIRFLEEKEQRRIP